MMRTPILAIMLALLPALAAADHHEANENANGDPAAMTEEAMMAALARAATPGEPHAMLAESVGNFTAAMSMYMDPSAPPSTATMTVERTMDLDGRVLLEHWQGEVAGMPFEGRGRTGYDNVTQRYWSTWTDSWSTGLLVMYGDWDPAESVLVFTGTGTNPMTGDTYTMRSVGGHDEDGNETMSMYEDHGQGERLSMSVTLTRR